MADLELGQAHADRLKDISQDLLRARSKAAHLPPDAVQAVKDALTRSVTRLEALRVSILADADYTAHLADVAATEQAQAAEQSQVEVLTARVAELETQLATVAPAEMATLTEAPAA